MLARIACLVALALAALLAGCTAEGKPRNPKALAAGVHVSASAGVTIGLQALCKTPAKYAEVKRDADVAKKAIDGVLLPLFRQQDLADVTRAASDQALQEFANGLSPQVQQILKVAIEGALAAVELPENPSAKLDDGQRLVIVSLLEGMSEGISAFDAWGGPQ